MNERRRTRRRMITLPNELLDLFPAPGGEDERAADESVRRAKKRALGWCLERWRELLDGREFGIVRLFLDGFSVAEIAESKKLSRKFVSETIAAATLMLAAWRSLPPKRRVAKLAGDFRRAADKMTRKGGEAELRRFLGRPAVRETISLAARRFVLHPSVAGRVLDAVKKALGPDAKPLAPDERRLLADSFARLGESLARGKLGEMMCGGRKTLRVLLEPDPRLVRKLAREM